MHCKSWRDLGAGARPRASSLLHTAENYRVPRDLVTKGKGLGQEQFERVWDRNSSEAVHQTHSNE